MNEHIIEFHEAAAEGNIEKLKAALDNAVDINSVNPTNRQRRPAILTAAINKHYKAVQFLIDAGADINQQDETNLNPFLWSCMNNDLELLRIMIKAKPNLNALSRMGGIGITPAAEKGHLEVVKELLETTDISTNHTNNLGWTTLIEAIILNDGKERQQEIVRLLLEYGANPNMPDKYGVSPLTLAREKGYTEIADLLIAAGGK